MKNNQNNTGGLKLPQAIDFSMNQRPQFNSPRFTVEDSAKLNSPSLKGNLIGSSKIGFKANSSTQQLYNQQLQSSSLSNQSQNQLQNSLSTSNINSTSKIFAFNQDQKRGYSAKKKDGSGNPQQESSASSIQGYVQKFFQQQQQQQQSSQNSNQNGILDIASLSKQPIRKSPITAPYMIKKQDLNAIPPTSNTPSGQNLPPSRKATHRKTQSSLVNSQSTSSYSQNYQLPPYQRAKDLSVNDALGEDKSASKSNMVQDKTFQGISKSSSTSTNIPQLPLTLSGQSQLSPSSTQNDSIVKMNSVFQPTSPYFNQSVNNQQQNYQNDKYSSGQVQQPEYQTKSARTTPKQNLIIDPNQTPKQGGVDQGYHPLSAKNSQSKKVFNSNIIQNNQQANNQRGNRSSSGHMNQNIKNSIQKGEVLLQKKLEQINTERLNAGKSYSFTQGQLQQALAIANSNSSSNNSNSTYQMQQTQYLGNRLNSQVRNKNTNSLVQSQQNSNNNEQQSRQNTPQIKKSKVENTRKKPISQSELERDENLDNPTQQQTAPFTERQNRKDQVTVINNANNTAQSNGNYKDKIIKQQHQLSLLVSQQKQESKNSDFEFDIKDKNDEKETQSCESENSTLNNNNNTTKNNQKNLNNSSENSTPVHNANHHSSNKKNISKKLLHDRQHPEISYYHHGLMKAFKTPYPMDTISVLYRQHFLQTCQGVLYSNLARPVNPKDLVTKRVQLGPRNPKYRKTLIFDMDETLIHCNENTTAPCDVVVDVKFPTGEFIQAGINVRPYAIEILQELSEEFEIVIFTASHSCYAQAVIDFLDPHKKYVHHRYYRDQCIQTPQGVYIKDLRVFTDRQLHEMVLIDNAAYSFSFQVDNGIPIVPFYDSKADTELLHLCTYLRNLHNVNDVRAYNRQNLKMSVFNEPEGPQKVYENLFKKNQ